MAASTAPAAKQALLDILKDRPNLNAVQITWGEPSEQEDLQDELIYFQDPVTRQPDWRVLGGDYLDETYSLILVIKNRTYGDDRGATETRTWALVDEVEQAIREDVTLGGVLKGNSDRGAIDFDEQEVVTSQLSDGWFGVATVPLICSTRI